MKTIAQNVRFLYRKQSSCPYHFPQSSPVQSIFGQFIAYALGQLKSLKVIAFQSVSFNIFASIRKSAVADTGQQPFFAIIFRFLAVIGYKAGVSAEKFFLSALIILKHIYQRCLAVLWRVFDGNQPTLNIVHGPFEHRDIVRI